MKIKNLLMTIATAAAPLMVAAPAFAYDSHRTQGTSQRSQAEIEVEKARIALEFRQRRDAYSDRYKEEVQRDRERLGSTEERNLAYAQRREEALRHYAQEEALRDAKIAALSAPRYEPRYDPRNERSRPVPSRWDEQRGWERRDDYRVRYELRADDRDPPRDLIRELHNRGEYRTPDARIQLRFRF